MCNLIDIYIEKKIVKVKRQIEQRSQCDPIEIK